jgi:hypothetical protein
MAKPTKTTTPPVTTIDLAALLADLDKSNDGMLDSDTALTKEQVEDALSDHAVDSAYYNSYFKPLAPLVDARLARKSWNRRVSGKQQRNINDSPPSFMIKFCLARAAECRRQAEQAMDSPQQRSWRNMEGRWFFLARSYANELGRRDEDAARKGMERGRNRVATRLHRGAAPDDRADIA